MGIPIPTILLNLITKNRHISNYFRFVLQMSFNTLSENLSFKKLKVDQQRFSKSDAILLLLRYFSINCSIIIP